MAAAAYITERLLRWTDCANESYARRALALMYVNQGRFEDARRELDAFDTRVGAGECPAAAAVALRDARAAASAADTWIGQVVGFE